MSPPVTLFSISRFQPNLGMLMGTQSYVIFASGLTLPQGPRRGSQSLLLFTLVVYFLLLLPVIFTDFFSSQIKFDPDSSYDLIRVAEIGWEWLKSD